MKLSTGMQSRRIGIMSGLMPLESFIQSNAAVNPGNSDVALVNLSGDSVGIKPCWTL